MAGNVYGLRLLGDPLIRRVGLWIVAITVLAYRLVQLPLVPARQVAYDFGAYWAAAGRLLHGQALYFPEQLAGAYAPQQQNLYLYPPPVAALVTPFAILFPGDVRPALLLWSLLGGAAAIAGILAVARREGLAERFAVLRGRGLWLLAVAALALPPVVDELINGNVHLFLVALFAVAWLGLRSESTRGDRIAGLALGLATLMKLFPVLILVWLVVRGRRQPAWWAVIGAVAVTLVTLPLTGLQPWLDYPAVLLNQSAPIDTSASLSPTVWLAPLLGFGPARLVVSALGLGLVIWLARRADERVGYAATIVIAMLLTPSLWTHYLTVLLVPLVLALAAGVSGVVMAVVYVFLSAGYQPLLGDMVWITVRALPTLGVLILLGALVARVRAAGPVPAGPAAAGAPDPAREPAT